MNRVSKILGPSGKPFELNGQANGTALMVAPRKARLTYDAARDTDEYRRHWANSDALDPDSSNSQAVRHKLMRRSRYENGSNGYYAGIIRTHCNMVVGVGPTLRMTTKNRDFNQFVEREFYAWAQRIQLRRKLWCMCHARIQDGEAFAIMQTNPAIPMGRVQLDLTLIEGEQVQTPFLPFNDPHYTDGIKRDGFGNVLWYDVLPAHPGAAQQFMNMQAIRVSPREMLHWFKMERPGDHRSPPAMTSTLNLGASARRYREATLRKAEINADFSVLLESTALPEEGSLTDPMSSFDIEHGMMTMLPDGAKPHDLANNTPNENYNDFNRTHVSETARPISQSYNVAGMDSSNYSFASGKFDFLCSRLEINVERADCNDEVLDPMFEEWFGEWSLVGVREEGPPTHQWDWPAHPIIDAEADARANETKLKTATVSMRDVYTEQSKDYEDELLVQAQDTFGEATPEAVDKMRKINVLKNTPDKALPFVAEIMGVTLPTPDKTSDQPQAAASAQLAQRQTESQVFNLTVPERQVIYNAPDVIVNVPKQDAPRVNVAQPAINVAPAAVNVAGAQIDVHVPEQEPPTVNVAAAQVHVPEQQPPVVNVAGPIVNVPEQLAPVVNVAATEIRIPEQPAPVVNVAQPVINVESPTVNVAPPEVHVAPAQVIVNTPEQAAPIVNVAAPDVHVAPAQVTVQTSDQPAPIVNVAPAQVTVEKTHVDVHVPPQPEFDVVPERDPKTGRAKKFKRVPKGKS